MMCRYEGDYGEREKCPRLMEGKETVVRSRLGNGCLDSERERIA